MPRSLLYISTLAVIVTISSLAPTRAQSPRSWQNVLFTPVFTDFFESSGGQAVAWSDVNADGRLDLAVAFQGFPLRLYIQSEQGFTEAADALGLPPTVTDTRTLSWGDFNQDGWSDLYVGFGRDANIRNRLFKGGKNGFTEVGAAMGVDAAGTSRQASWIDYDNDGDSDLFVAMRDRASKLYRNDGARFTDVSQSANMADPRRSVGSVWFDFDRDGDLDLYTANQSGDRDGFYRNDGGNFTEIAVELGMDLANRPLKEGSVGATLCDVNADGWLDLFVPTYGRDRLYIADRLGGFSEQAERWGVDGPDQAVSADCGDFDNDGREDLYVVAYRPGEPHGRDRLYHNRGDHFADVFPASLLPYDGDHGVRWADYDSDGDLDLVLTNRDKDGRHSLLRNDLQSGKSARYLKIMVLDHNGHYTRQGDEIRVYDSKTRRLIATRLIDTGGGYISQNMMPVHVGLGGAAKVDVEVTSMRASGRHITHRRNVPANSSLVVRVSER